MVSRDFGQGIDTRLSHRDLGIVLDLAQESGLPLPAGAVVKQQINALMGAGDGGADFSVSTARSNAPLQTVRMEDESHHF